MDETRRNFEQDMGSEFGSLYWVLWNDWANARLRYEELMELSRFHGRLISGSSWL